MIASFAHKGSEDPYLDGCIGSTASAEQHGRRRWSRMSATDFRSPADPILFRQPHRVSAREPRRLLRVRAPHLRAGPAGPWWR
jgi:hypothetical protein